MTRSVHRPTARLRARSALTVAALALTLTGAGAAVAMSATGPGPTRAHGATADSPYFFCVGLLDRTGFCVGPPTN